MSKQCPFTPDFKAKLVQQLLSEERALSQMVTEHGIHPNQLDRWRPIALDGLLSLFSVQGVQELARNRVRGWP